MENPKKPALGAAPLFGKVWDTLVAEPAYTTASGKKFHVLRLDVLAKRLNTNDPHGLLKSLQLYMESQRAGLVSQAFAIIPGRQQESYGLLQTDFPRREMPPMPDELKKRRVAKKKDAKDDGKNWYPYIAIDTEKDLVREADPFDDINEVLQSCYVEDDDGAKVRLLDVDGIRLVLRKDGWLVTRDTTKPADEDTKTE